MVPHYKNELLSSLLLNNNIWPDFIILILKLKTEIFILCLIWG